jgi:hypothetical protein
MSAATGGGGARFQPMPTKPAGGKKNAFSEREPASLT